MITYTYGDKNNIDSIEPLFKKLSRYHEGVSKHFAKEFDSITFDERKGQIASKTKVKIITARDNNKAIGYIIASINKGIGEVESLFIDDGYRGKSVGDFMMKEVLSWMNVSCKEVKVSVAYGNQVITFYEKFGFYPRSIILKTKEMNRSVV